MPSYPKIRCLLLLGAINFCISTKDAWTRHTEHRRSSCPMGQESQVTCSATQKLNLLARQCLQILCGEIALFRNFMRDPNKEVNLAARPLRGVNCYPDSSQAVFSLKREQINPSSFIFFFSFVIIKCLRFSGLGQKVGFQSGAYYRLLDFEVKSNFILMFKTYLVFLCIQNESS